MDDTQLTEAERQLLTCAWNRRAGRARIDTVEALQAIVDRSAVIASSVERPAL